MTSERPPAIVLDACVCVVALSPFARLDRARVFSCHAGPAAIFVQFAAVSAPIGGVDKAVGQFSRFTRHLRGSGRTNQRQNYWWPAQRCPLAAVAWWLGKRGPQLLHMLIGCDATKDPRAVPCIKF